MERKEKRRSRGGFTLAETLMAVLILVMVSAVAAAGIPAAVNAYRKVVSAANAQLLVSTTAARLRDELGKATDIVIDGTTVTYTHPGGSTSRIYLVSPGTGVEKPGIWLHEYKDRTDPGSVYDHLLVSHEASDKNLYATYDPIPAADYQNGILTIRNLTVKRGNTALVTVETLQIRVLADKRTAA